VTGSTDSNVFPAGNVTLLSAGQTIDLPFHEYLMDMDVEVVSKSSWTGRLKLFDHQGDRLEQIIIAAGHDRDIDVQWGWADPTNNFQRQFHGSVMGYALEFMPHGSVVNFEVVSRSAFSQVIDRRIRSFQEGQRVSDIVREIAQSRGWTVQIEDSVGFIEQPFNSKGESDLNFILEQLLPHAVSEQGSDFLCYFDEADVFHFHSPFFGTPVQHSYNFTRDASGDVIMFSPQDNQLFGALFGGGNSLYSSPTSLQGGQAEQQTAQGAGLNGQGAPAAVDASAQVDLGAGVHSYNNIVARDPAEVERLTRARYAEYRRKAFKANLRVHGTHRVRVSDYVNVDFTKTDGTPHYLSGNFLVLRVKHTVGVGLGWTTEFEMQREGIEALPGTVPLAVTQTVSPQPGGDDDDLTLTAT
jgi:hypothetical protein